MNRKNNMRKIYLIYFIVLGELLSVSFILSAGFITDPVLQLFVRIAGFAGLAIVPLVGWIFYKWLKRDNAANSDELEQLVLTKSFAATGFTAISLMPVLLILSCLFTAAAGYIVFGYCIVIAAVCKFSTYYYHKKY